LLDGNPFSLENHEYQQAPLECTAPRQVFLKGAQVGITSIIMLKSLHGLISSRYPQGCLYLFPSLGDVLDFSRGRFNPLINDNDDVAKYVQDTDSQTIKRIGKAMLYLRGARSTAKVGGMKRTSTALKSVPVDRLVFDEADEMAPDMIDLALERISHSSVKEEVYLSTPTIPDYGVDRLYQQSDQRVWMIKCSKCGKETCLELEFPECLEELRDGRVIRLCQRCRDNEIFPKDGSWIAQSPGKDMVGWRISQLNSMFVEPGKILQLFRDPPNGNISEVYNSKLGQAHIDAENRLTYQEVINLCGVDPMSESGQNCYMGVDVGKKLHCVIGDAGRVVFIGEFEDWNRLSSLIKAFDVRQCVIDALPETRMSKDFAEAHEGIVFCCYYQEHQKGSYAWNEKELIVAVNRTESLDASHSMLQNQHVILPRESHIVQEFARHCSNIARVLQTDPETGSTRYLYVKTGPDHFRHAFNYMCIAQKNETMFEGLDFT